MKRRWLAIVGGLVVLGVLLIMQIYPRNVAISLKGVEYRLGAPQTGVRPITLSLHGVFSPSLFGSPTFSGVIDVRGSVPRDRLNGQTEQITFADHAGSILSSYARAGVIHDYLFGSLFPNARFTQFALLVRDPNGTWSTGNGLMIAAPARTRRQALRLSNALLKPAGYVLPGHPLK